MEAIRSESGAQAAPRSGAPAPAPFLDKGDGNVPDNSGTRSSWNRKQWSTRRAVIDRLRLWQSSGYQCLWVTLTSSPTSSEKRLRANFQTLRKRLDRHRGFPGVEYICVDTREGHGVLHMIWAWKDPNPAKRASFYIPFDWLQAAWRDIHGAFHVNVKRIGGRDRDARRLSRYIVAQYCGDQNALVRVSQSRMEFPLSRMRTRLLSVIKGLPERYAFGHQMHANLTREEFVPVFNAFLWKAFRQAWVDLVRSRSCEAFGVKLVWWDGELRRA
jgi:hypothetical protein